MADVGVSSFSERKWRGCGWARQRRGRGRTCEYFIRLSPRELAIDDEVMRRKPRMKLTWAGEKGRREAW